MKKHLLLILKLGITVSVLWWVFHKLGVEGRANLLVSVRHAKPAGLILAFSIFVLTTFIGIIRWRMLLRTQGMGIPFWHLAWITGVGLFFNLFLIGATGGDFFKAWYVARAQPARKPQAVLSILVDRLIGLVGLFVLAACSVLAYRQVLSGHSQTRMVVPFVLGGLGIVLVVALASTQRHRIVTQGWWLWIWHRLPGREIFRKLSESYDQYGRSPGVLFTAFMLSMGVHALMVVAAWAIGWSIGIEGLGLKHYFVYCPIINAIAAVPVTVGGLGLREGAYQFFLALEGVHSPDATALSLIFYGNGLLLGLICGVAYVLGKPKNTTDHASQVVETH